MSTAKLQQLVDKTPKRDKNQDFAQEMDMRASVPRGGMFSMPLPLTIGDSSTNY